MARFYYEKDPHSQKITIYDRSNSSQDPVAVVWDATLAEVITTALSSNYFQTMFLSPFTGRNSSYRR